MQTEIITGRTRLGGLLGSPVEHSISPLMHNESFRILGIDAVYLCFNILPEQLETTVKAFRELNVYGFNLTMPDKTAVIPYLDELDEQSRMIGAVNTVVNREGKLIGYNTDGTGFLRCAAEAGCDIKGKEMTLLGAGGAGCAIAAAAALGGASAVHLVSRRGRSWERAREMTDRINERTSCRADLTDLADTVSLRRVTERSVLLTNATSVGMASLENETPVPDTSVFFPELTVSDVIYHPARTRFLKEAAEKGCRTFNGMYMLLYQGEEAFHLWTGRQMPTQAVRDRYF